MAGNRRELVAVVPVALEVREFPTLVVWPISSRTYSGGCHWPPSRRQRSVPFSSQQEVTKVLGSELPFEWPGGRLVAALGGEEPALDIIEVDQAVGTSSFAGSSQAMALIPIATCGGKPASRCLAWLARIATRALGKR